MGKKGGRLGVHCAFMDRALSVAITTGWRRWRSNAPTMALLITNALSNPWSIEVSTLEQRWNGNLGLGTYPWNGQTVWIWKQLRKLQIVWIWSNPWKIRIWNKSWNYSQKQTAMYRKS